MINVVILAAGLGERFKNAGFKTPKPFIDICGKTMIERVLDGLKCRDAYYSIVVRKCFIENYAEKIVKIANSYNAHIISVSRPTTGAAATALFAALDLPDSDPVVFADSDNILGNGIFKMFTERANDSKKDGFLLTFKSSDEKFSFAKLDAEGNVNQIREKVAISNRAIAGYYYFSSAKIFKKCAVDTLIYPRTGEYYMSQVCNSLIEFGGKIGVCDISEDSWDCVGTPSQLEIFLNKKNM